jgi:hypothetical protein
MRRQQRTHKILVALDPSENAVKAVAYAAGTLPKSIQINLYRVFLKPFPQEIEGKDACLQHHISFHERIEEAKDWLAWETKVVQIRSIKPGTCS